MASSWQSRSSSVCPPSWLSSAPYGRINHCQNPPIRKSNSYFSPRQRSWLRNRERDCHHCSLDRRTCCPSSTASRLMLGIRMVVFLFLETVELSRVVVLKVLRFKNQVKLKRTFKSFRCRVQICLIHFTM